MIIDLKVIDNYTRKDKSLWRIAICLPDSYIFKLTNMQDRSSITTRSTDNINTDKEALNNKKTTTLDSKAVTSNHHAINSKQKKLLNISTNDELDNRKADSFNKQSNITFPKSTLPSNSDFLKSSLHINRDSRIKNSISNLCGKPKVAFQNFVEKIAATGNNSSLNLLIKAKRRKKTTKLNSFNLITELIKKKLKLIPKDKADKARKFACALIRKKVSSGYAASLTANELAKELNAMLLPGNPLA